MRHFKSRYRLDREYHCKCDKCENNLPSETIQGLSYSAHELLERFVQGIPLPPMNVYDDKLGTTIDPRLRQVTTDKFDIADAYLQARRDIAEMAKQEHLNNEAMINAYKAQQESQPPQTNETTE